MSIKGSSYGWMVAAIRRGDLAGIRAAAIELDRRVNLADALSIVLVMAKRHDSAYDRAAAKWLARLAYERPAVGLNDLLLGLAALELLPHNPRVARQLLADLCRRHGLGNVIGCSDADQP